MKKNKQSSLYLFIVGFLMGSANVIPGVSGGTIAFIMGVYDRIIKALKTISIDFVKLFLSGKFKEAFKKIPFSFIIPLAFGMVVAIFSLAKLIAFLLTDYSSLVFSFFFGLIVGSIILVSLELKKVKKWKFLFSLFGGLFGFWLIQLTPLSPSESLLSFFVAGAIAVTTMILPGVSGSFVLLIMGKYHQILSIVNERNFSLLLIIMLGGVVGIVCFSFVLNFFFKNYRQATILFLIGLMIGTLPKIWPYRQVEKWAENKDGEKVALIEKMVLPKDNIEWMQFSGLSLLGLIAIVFIEKNKQTEA
jgi:putative membrane protein